MRRITIMLVIAVLLGSCGTKGALYIAPPDTDDTPKRRPR
jgi:predicted small lipoprotein YifL